MNNSTRGKRLREKAFYLTGLLTFFFLLSLSSIAQMRDYGLVYSENIKGGTTMFGNTLLHAVNILGRPDLTKMNGNKQNGNSTYGNDTENMQYIDIDGNKGIGSATRNSSSADLILPAGTNNIKLARLYWGGRISNTDFDMSKAANRTIKIKKSSATNYSDVVAAGIDQTTIITGFTEYQAYADITNYVKAEGAGTYIVGNVPLSTGKIDNGGNHGGWSIVVVYENPALPYNSIRVYDGFQEVYNSGDPTVSTVTLTGLDVPSGTLESADARMGVLAWEGDANLDGDFLKINGHTFSNATNQANNPWNGTITDNGVHVTTKNPNYTNQMGLDIDMFNVGVGYGIMPNDNSVTLQFGTEKDKYFPGVFTFAIKMKDPTITLDKTVSDENGNGLAEKNEILTYTLKGKNSGIGNANAIILKDTLPNTVTYVPGSMKVIHSPGIAAGSVTDNAGDDIAEYIVNGQTKTIVFRLGAGANATHGGVLAEGETYEVQFQVRVNNPGNGQEVPSILNIARITSESDAGVTFVDDGTAFINPQGGPVPVVLSIFKASLLNEKLAQLDWVTSQEINNSHFILERSTDAHSFAPVATISGNGTTSLQHHYSFKDNISGVSASVIYYRLRQIDLDGKSNLSEVVSLKIQRSVKNVNVSPNPFINSVTISAEWDKADEATAQIINMQGKVVISRTIRLNKGYNQVTIDNLSNLPAGNYVLQLISSNGRIIQKIIK